MTKLIVPVQFSGSRETKTYVYLYKTAKNALSIAESTTEGRIYNLMTVYIFLAFAFEAYINHLGIKSISNWSKKERGWGQEGRRNRVFKKYNVLANYDEQPFSIIPIIFTFRDCLAHGNTEVVTVTNEVKEVDWNDPDMEQVLVPSWLSKCTVENANEAFHAIEQIFNILGNKAGDKYPLRSLGTESFNLSRLDTA